MVNIVDNPPDLALSARSAEHQMSPENFK
jgi:hypothetical protein